MDHADTPDNSCGGCKGSCGGMEHTEAPGALSGWRLSLCAMLMFLAPIGLGIAGAAAGAAAAWSQVLGCVAGLLVGVAVAIAVAKWIGRGGPDA